MHQIEKMARLLAIDYGLKRVGIAVTDELQLIASGLCTIDTSVCMDFISSYVLKEPVESIIIGMPKNLSNKSTDATPHVKGFVKRLKKQFSQLTIITVDERFTSKIAFQSMIDMGLKKQTRKKKALVDEISATLILQSYMAQQDFNK